MSADHTGPPTAITGDPVRPRRGWSSLPLEAWAVAMVFFTNGAVFASWLPRIPEIQQKLDLSEGALGIAFLGMPIGGLSAMTAAGWLCARLGAAKVMTVATVLFALSVVLPALAPSLSGLLLALVVLGVTSGAMDVSMNAEAVAIERRCRRPIMGLAHGFFSIGAMVGAAVGGLVAEVGLDPVTHLALVAAFFAPLGLIVCLFLRRRADPRGHGDGPSFAWPSRVVLGLGALAFCILLGEGAMQDWSAVFMTSNLDTGPFLAGAAFAAFAGAMAIGRLLGDRIVAAFGPRRVVQGGALAGTGGMVLALTSDDPAVAIAGFALVGLGYSGIVPILFRAAAMAPGMAAGPGIAAVATLGYTGFLVGPPVIGGLAELVGLPTALALVPLLSFLVAVMAGRVLPRHLSITDDPA